MFPQLPKGNKILFKALVEHFKCEAVVRVSVIQDQTVSHEFESINVFKLALDQSLGFLSLKNIDNVIIVAGTLLASDLRIVNLKPNSLLLG